MCDHYVKLAVSGVDQFLYGRAPRPIALKNGMVIGGGQVYPELNFTLPPMIIEESTYPVVRNHYRQMTKGALAARSTSTRRAWWWRSSFCRR